MSDLQSFEEHNKLVPELLVSIINASRDEADAWVIAESLLTGMMLNYRPNPEHAGYFMELLSARVIQRLLEFEKGG